MAGFVYLAWAAACYSAKWTAKSLEVTAEVEEVPLSQSATLLVRTFAHWPHIIFDVAGPVWMLASLYLVIRASRQRRIISWSWLLISCQAITAILIASYAAMACSSCGLLFPGQLDHADWTPGVVGVAVLIWACALIWLVRQRLQYQPREPAIRDGSKTHTYRR